MVRRSFTAVLEKNTTWTQPFQTEPYETGWATEARWFVRILEMKGSGSVQVTPQISPDGLFWCDLEGLSRPTLNIDAVGVYSFALRDFGHWLRLRVELPGESMAIKVMIYLALKE